MEQVDSEEIGRTNRVVVVLACTSFKLHLLIFVWSVVYQPNFPIMMVWLEDRNRKTAVE